MKVVDVSGASSELLALLSDVENGEEVAFAHDGKTIALVSKAFERTPGLLAKTNQEWRDWTYDPAVFAPLMTDEDLEREGWPT